MLPMIGQARRIYYPNYVTFLLHAKFEHNVLQMYKKAHVEKKT